MSNNIYKQIESMQKFTEIAQGPYKRLQEQVNLMNNVLSANYQQINLVSLNTQAMIDAVNAIQQFNLTYHEIIQSAMEPYNNRIKELQRVINQMSNVQSFSVNIPPDIYPMLAKLSTSFTDLMPKDVQHDLINSITVHQPYKISTEDESTNEVNNQKWTWGQLLQFLLLLFQILQPFYLEHQNTIQSEKQHNELLIQDERQHIQLMEQNERIHQESLEAMNEFMEFLLPFLPVEEDNNEADDIEAHVNPE